MKKHFFRLFSVIISVVIVCTAFASCSGKDLETNESTQTSSQTSAVSVTDVETIEAELPTEEPTEPSTTAVYAMNNGQWGQFARYEYNGRGQILSVTTISPFTLAPLCYEVSKIDRVYSYDDNGRMNRVWLSYGYIFELTYSADGLTAEGSCKKNDDNYSARLIFSDKGTLVKEEYASAFDTMVFEYNTDGKVVNAESNGFVTKHTYSDNKVQMSLENKDGQRIADYTVTLDGTSPIEISAQGDVIKLTYEGGVCTKGDYNGQIYTIKYDTEGRVVSTEVDGNYRVTESFEYNSDARISRYIRERKTSLVGAWVHERYTMSYTYAQDGTITKVECEKVEYDNNGNETYRRTEEY